MLPIKKNYLIRKPTTDTQIKNVSNMLNGEEMEVAI